MKTYILAPGSYGDIVADKLGIEVTDRTYTADEATQSGQDGNSLIAQNVSRDPKGSFGIIPVHNLYGMTVGRAVAAIIKQGGDLTIVGDYLLPINHVLAMRSNNLSSPIQIYSHEQALKQCGDTLKEKYPTSLTIKMNATSQAIAKLSETDAVICAEETATQNGLHIIDRTINPPNNETLFVIIATTGKLEKLLSGVPETENITSLISMTLTDTPGSFVDTLVKLEQSGGKKRADMRGLSTIYSHVKAGGVLNGIHLIYRNLAEEKASKIGGISLVPRRLK